MNFIKTSKTTPKQRTKEECLQAIADVVHAEKLTNEQLNKFVNLLEDDAKLKRALMFL